MSAPLDASAAVSREMAVWMPEEDGRVDGIKTDVDLNLAFLRAKH